MLLHRGVLATIVLGMLAGCAGPAPEGDPDPNRVVAEVNGVSIPASRVRAIDEADLERFDPVLQEAAAAVAGDEQDAARRALKLAISGELLIQAAQKKGATAGETEIDERQEVLRSQFQTDEEFAAHLAETGLTPETFRRQIGRRLTIADYARSITDGIAVDEAEARKVYDAEPERFMEDEQVRVSRVFVGIRPHDPEERRTRARSRLEDARRRALAGEDFGALADEYSFPRPPTPGGDMGFVARGHAGPELERVIFSTPVGEISEIFESPKGLHMIRVTERREAAVAPFEKVRAGLMMVLARDMRGDALREHVDELRAAATVEILDPQLQP
ncbi:MAG: hypothetical protein GY716_03315 [bacterium]|nr:hypothetical protein [bacterium]